MTEKILPTFVDLEDPVHKIIYDKNLPYEPCKVFTTLPIVLPKDSLKGKKSNSCISGKVSPRSIQKSINTRFRGICDFNSITQFTKEEGLLTLKITKK